MRTANPARRIEGRHHALIQRIRAMVRSGELLDSGPDGAEVLLETPNLIDDAIRSGVPIAAALVRADASPGIRALLRSIPSDTKTYEVESKLFPELTSTENNPGLIALAKAPLWKQEDLFAGAEPLIVVLAGVQDPGNLGTILRAAEAFGATGVLAAKGTVSPYNSKAIRAASGTLFRLPLLRNLTVQQIVLLLARKNISLLASTAHGGTPLAAMDLAKPLALAVGSEGAGLPREFENAGIRVSIPMASQVESLNVATAACILLYEVARQRSLGDLGGRGSLGGTGKGD